MRALEDYHNQTSKNLSQSVGVCMRNLWTCYAAIIAGWFVLVLFYHQYEKGMFFHELLLPVGLTGLCYLIYAIIIMKPSRELNPILAYGILNVYLIILLMHPSGILVLDGLYFALISMFPIWNERLWIKRQLVCCGLIVILRHCSLYQMHFESTGAYGHPISLFGLFCIGVTLYSCGCYVHDQTMMLGDATKMDAATGLYNHECFYEELESRMATYKATPEKEKEGAAFCLFIADIDNFKKVNDTYGHAYGDEVLLGLANIFKTYCGSKDFAARYGGEEFVMIVGGCHMKDALTRANTIRKQFSVSTFKDADGVDHQFTVSLGVAEYEHDWTTASKFFDQADQALYRAKNTGKNRVCSIGHEG